MNVLTIYCDGGSRGNPGPSAIGYVVLDNDKSVREAGECIGMSTNNVAEYEAVRAALNWLIQSEYRPADVMFLLDSQLVVNQLTGIYKIKEAHLKDLAIAIHALIRRLKENGFGDVSFSHIPRSQNRQADALVNSSLDGAGY